MSLCNHQVSKKLNKTHSLYQGKAQSEIINIMIEHKNHQYWHALFLSTELHYNFPKFK